VNNSAGEIVFTFAALLITFILTTLRVVSISRRTICRDFVMLGLHVMSVLSLVGFILLHSEFYPGDIELCRLSNSLQYTGEYLRRICALGVYGLRLNAFIGPIYPKWVRYISLFPIALFITFLCSVLNIEESAHKGAFITDDGVCWDLRSDSSFLILDIFVIMAILEAVPHIIYLALFIFPMLKYRYDVLSSNIRKHFLIAAVDIVVELLFVAVVMSTRHKPSPSYWTAQLMLYSGLVCSNVMLIFVFVDWRKYLCIKDSCLYRDRFHSEESNEALEKISLQANSIEKALLP